MADAFPDNDIHWYDSYDFSDESYRQLASFINNII